MADTSPDRTQSDGGEMEKAVAPVRRREHEPGTEPETIETAAVVYDERAEFYLGSLPHPELVRQYEECYPGATKRLFDQLDKETQHRHKLETQGLTAQIEDLRTQRSLEGRGQWFAFFITMGFIISGSLIAILRPTTAGAIGGSILGASGLVTIVLAFLRTHLHGNRAEERPADENEQEQPEDQQPVADKEPPKH